MMERLTNDFSVNEMSMYSLAHNCCYIEEESGEAWYRDYETEISAREFAREILREHDILEFDDNAMLSDDAFDEEILEMLMCDPKTIEGLTALFYRNLWAMAELRERLKRYENLEEQGLLLRLPCAEKTVVYQIDHYLECKYDFECVKTGIDEQHMCEDGLYCEHEYPKYYVKENLFTLHLLGEIGKTVSLTREEAEVKLKELEGE